MNYVPHINRRSFVVGATAVGGGLALGLDIPFGGPEVVRAADGSPEITAWVVIKPDDTVVIRMARSEMGQGTITGLAQKYGKSAAQIVLRWHIELGNVVIPKSVTPSRIRENIDVFDFELAPDDRTAIAELNNGRRTGLDPDTFS